jgi:hypothetical protein
MTGLLRIYFSNTLKREEDLMSEADEYGPGGRYESGPQGEDETRRENQELTDDAPAVEDTPTGLTGPATPGEGEIANEEVAQARRDIEAELNVGSMDPTDVFEQSDNERKEGTTHRVVGHMHIKAVLAAYFSNDIADQILNSAGLAPDRHVDTIGDQERNDLMDLVEAYE